MCNVHSKILLQQKATQTQIKQIYMVGIASQLISIGLFVLASFGIQLLRLCWLISLWQQLDVRLNLIDDFIRIDFMWPRTDNYTLKEIFTWKNWFQRTLLSIHWGMVSTSKMKIQNFTYLRFYSVLVGNCCEYCPGHCPIRPWFGWIRGSQAISGRASSSGWSQPRPCGL